MTILVANTSNTNTFEYWINRTNELATAMSTYAITTDSNTTVGNAAITGTFTANNLFVNNTLSVNTITVNTSIILPNSISINTSISIGNSTVNTVVNSSSLAITNSTANIVLNIPTSTQISNGQYYFNANGTWSLVSMQSLLISNGSITTTGTSAQNIDSYSTSSYTGAEYFITVIDNDANNQYISKILTTHNFSTAFLTEYGQIITNTAIGTFSATIAMNNVILQFTPISSNTTVNFARTVL